MRWLTGLSERAAALLTALVVLAAYLPLSQTPLVRQVEGELLDLGARLKAEQPVSDAIVLVLIDEQSIRELGRWPWSRGVLAELVATVSNGGARAIGLDLLLAEPEPAVVPAAWLEALRAELDRLEARQAPLDSASIGTILERFLGYAPGDDDLAGVMRAAGNVIVPFSFEFAPGDGPGAPAPPYLTASAYRIAHATGVGGGPPAAQALLPPIDIIGAAAAGLGHANIGLDPGEAARFEYPVVAYRSEYYPSFALELARQFLGLPRERVVLQLGRGILLGERFVPTDEVMRLAINHSRAERFARFPAAAVLQGGFPAAAFQDKVVLIGGAAAGIGARLLSPLSGEMTGLERHAMVIDNILTGDFVLRRNSWTLFGFGFVALGSLVLSQAAARYSALGATIALALLLAGLLLGGLLAYLWFGVWLDLFLPLVGLLLIWASAVSLRYVASLRQQRTLRTAFQHYLNPELVDQVARDPALLRLGGEEKELTVLFADIRNSTRIASRLPPAEFVQMLNEYFAAMTRMVFAHDGMLDKYVGDGMVVVFGAPLTRPNHAESACRTALAMLDALAPLQKRWARPDLAPLEMGVGINTGPMIIGNMGSSARFDYTVIGDEANLGSRLEAANKDFRTRILISEATFRQVQGRIAARELDLIRFRGMERPVHVYEVLGLEPLPEPERRRVELFAAGLAAYRADDLAGALEIFERLREERPDDHPAEIYVRRCRERLAGRHAPAGFALQP